MKPIDRKHPLRKWFSGLVESNFQCEIGLSDPDLLDYVTALLTEFVHIDRITLLRDGSGRRIENVAEAISDAELGPLSTDEERRRLVHRHIGDFTLFWTGVYPENMKRLARQNAADALIDYFQQGKRSYGIASELSDNSTEPPAKVLRMLSDHFEYCVYGLGLVRREWETAADVGGDSGIWSLQ